MHKMKEYIYVSLLVASNKNDKAKNKKIQKREI